MKYICLNDINHIFKKENKMLILYFIVIFLYFNLNILMGMNKDSTIYYNTLAICCDFSTSGWLEMLVFVFSIAIYVYITFQLFYKDIKFGLDNIYLRMNHKKWLLYKMTMIYFISALLLSIMYFIFYLLCLLHNIPLGISIFIYFKNLLYIFCVETIGLLFILVSSKIKILIPILILLFLSFFLFLPTNILKMNILLPLLLLLFASILLLLIYRKVYIVLIENS